MAKQKLKVIFSEDVPGQARRMETKEVSYGYFRNFLLPRNLAEVATKERLSVLEEKREELEQERRAREKEAQKKKESLKDVVLEIPVKVGEDDQVFGSVTKEDIEKALENKGVKGSIVLDKPIREIGQTKVRVSFGGGVSGEVTVKVKATKAK